MAKEPIDIYKQTPAIDIDLDTDDKDLIALSGKVTSVINNWIDRHPAIDLYTPSGLSMLIKAIGTRCRRYIDTKDIYNLDKWWSIYTYICCFYHIKPTLIRFSLMVGIARDTINDWTNTTRYEQKFGNLFSVTAKKWLAECEGNLYDEVIKSGNIGCMFALKANYGYRDNVDITVTNKDTGAPQKTIDDIAADYGRELLDGKRPAPAADF